MAAPTDRTGELLAEKYLLLRVLGRGGMGTVYEARNAQTEGRVAVKVLARGEGDPATAKRLLREARALAKLTHPNIVRLYDADERDGVVFLVQELLEGVTLRRHLDERVVLDPREALELLLPLTEALGYAHGLGVVHRDVKPENVILCDDGRGGVTPRLIDFGIALASTDDRTTRAGTAVGTPRYMSPEQAWGREDVDARSDVWSLGALAYECLAGETPYDGANDRAVLAAIVARDPRHLAHAGAAVPEALADAVMHALVRSRDARTASMRELRSALLALECFEGEPWFAALAAAYRQERPPASTSGERARTSAPTSDAGAKTVEASGAETRAAVEETSRRASSAERTRSPVDKTGPRRGVGSTVAFAVAGLGLLAAVAAAYRSFTRPEAHGEPELHARRASVTEASAVQPVPATATTAVTPAPNAVASAPAPARAASPHVIENVARAEPERSAARVVARSGSAPSTGERPRPPSDTAPAVSNGTNRAPIVEDL